jgi:hypothetical protein
MPHQENHVTVILRAVSRSLILWFHTITPLLSHHPPTEMYTRENTALFFSNDIVSRSVLVLQRVSRGASNSTKRLMKGNNFSRGNIAKSEMRVVIPLYSRY